MAKGVFKRGVPEPSRKLYVKIKIFRFYDILLYYSSMKANF